MSNQNNTTPRSSPQKKQYNNKPITPIKIKNGNQIIKQNEIINTDPDDFSSVDWTLVMSPHSKKCQHISSPTTSPKTKQSNTPSPFTTQNRYATLSENLPTQEMETDQASDLPNTKPQLPPPIFIKSELNYKHFCDAIKLLISPEELFCKSHINSLKLQTKSPDSFRKVIKVLKEKEVDFHTYQIKQDKPYRVVFRNLHHTTPIDLIIQELVKTDSLQDKL